MGKWPAAFMEELELMIRDARIMLRGTDAGQRERGRERLRDVIQAAEGSTYAEDARALLAGDERPAPATPPVDPELDKLTGLWPSIQGFDDHHLADFLRQLEAYHGMAVPLRTEVIRDLRKWIADALPRVGAGMKPAQVAALNDFVAAVRGVAAYEELPEFGQLRDVLFHLRLQETAERVYEALKAWALEEAQRLLDELSPLPDAFKAEVGRLQVGVYEVDELFRAVQSLLRQLPTAAPAKWFEARLQTKSLEQLRRHLADPRVPQEWRSRLEEARVRLAASVEHFVRAQALAAVAVQQLRDFQTEFDRLSGEAAGLRQADEDWFARGLAALSTDAGRRVEDALDPDELTAVATSLREDMEGMPPAVAARLREMADAAGKSAAAWKAMRDGKPFELPPPSPGSLPAPAACRAEATRYAAWLQQIEAVLSDFRGETPASERDYENGLRLAEEILGQAQDHALARKLQLEATRRIACYQLDRALDGWDLESFFELFGTNNPGEVYAALAADRDVLVALRSLTLQRPFADWRAASRWWEEWRAAEKRLPSAKPDALLQALSRQSAERQQQWYGALERLLTENLSPQEYEDAAASLAEDADTNLQIYRQELQRKAVIGRIGQHIGAGRLAEAERELEKLPSASTDAVRLRTHLMLAQARGRGGSSVAEFLCGEWSNVQRYVARPHDVLLETVSAVWAEGPQDWLNRLAQLLSRVLGRGEMDDATTRELADWQTWLEIESGLLNDSSSGAVKQLADYVRGAAPGERLDRRLDKILSHWHSRNNTLMLAWAEQAFRPKSAAAQRFDHATDDLLADSERAAEQVRGALAGRAELGLSDLRPLQDSLQREEERWQTLHDLLGLYLAHPVEHRRPSAKFEEAKSKLSELTRILTALARLKDADLRQKSARMDFDEAYSRSLRIKNVAARPHLLSELDRVRPLLDLFTLEQRIRETAERCRSKDALDVLESGLFDKLSGYVEGVIGAFARAGAEGGAMWRLVSAEYEALVYREACILLPPSGQPELGQLAATLGELHAEELQFTQAIAQLEDRDRQPKVPWGGAFDPEPHLDYLLLIPKQRPRSLKVYHRFDRARRDTLQLILDARESRRYLPLWVIEYLDEGLPRCANEH